jgi:hypothetical protein
LAVLESLPLLASTTGFNDYPAFLRPSAQVEAVIDRGPIQELIIKCRGGTAIVSFSKIDRKYCSPKFVCHSTLAAVLRNTCE